MPLALVFVLLRACRPPAIAGKISSIVVDAVDAASGRSLVHVGQKVYKLAPPSADFDATSTIVWVTRHIFVGAASDHSRPRSVCTAEFSIRGVSVRGRTSVAVFSLKAATGKCHAVSQATATDDQLVAATTAALPANRTIFSERGDVENSQASVAATCDIYESGHGDLFAGGCVKWRPSPHPVRSPRYNSTV